jgi:flavodoxin
MLGKAVGVEWQHQGPLGKVERLIMLMIFTLWQYAAVKSGAPAVVVAGFSITPLQICMVIFIALGQAAVLNRLNGQIKQINKLEWIKKNKRDSVRRKVLVVYDSATGNTAKTAAQIAEPLNADVKKVDEAGDPEQYDAVIIGTPNIRKRPTQKICAYIEANAGRINDYGVFVTYGMPVWGQISKAACFDYVEGALGKKPLATFSCKGFHAKYKTYKNHPDDVDLLDAFNFGIRIALKLEKESV